MRPLVRWTFVAMAAVGLLSPATAGAQECAGGRVASSATRGRCCWPGQTWSDEHARCAGPPRCPDGMAAEGDACVGSAALVAAPPAAYHEAAPPSSEPPAALAWPLVSTDIGHGVLNPRIARSSNEALLISGVTLLGVGYLASILTGVFDQTGYNCWSGSCNTWPFAFIPGVGGVLAGTVSLSGSRYSIGWGMAMGIPAGVTQLVGLALLIAGLMSENEELVPSMDVAGTRVHAVPYASSDAAGLSLTMEL